MTTTKVNGAVGAVEDGNTNRPQPSIYWFFTWNNYPIDWLGVVGADGALLQEYMYGEEIGVEETPHIQGCIRFKKRGRPSQLKWPKQIHWEKCRDWNKSIKYCMKEGKYHTNIKLPKPIKKPLDGKTLYKYQQEITDLINKEADDRSIYWYYDTKGNTGKSSLVKQIIIEHNDAVLITGKSADCKYVISEMKEKPTIVLYDISRTLEEHINYSVIEELKNGCFLSTKYESKMIVMNSPHIICFANFLPDLDKLSKDRWMIYEIQEDRTSLRISDDEDEYNSDDEFNCSTQVNIANFL